MLVNPVVLKRMTLGFSLFVSCVLVMAACGKLFYPAEFVKNLDRWVGSFELIFILLILCSRNFFALWLFASYVFAAWGGYVLYWYFLKLPCHCMGAMLNIPTLLSILVDILFCALSLILAHLLGAKRKWIYLSALFCLMAMGIGYFFGSYVYENVVVRM